MDGQRKMGADVSITIYPVTETLDQRSVASFEVYGQDRTRITGVTGLFAKRYVHVLRYVPSDGVKTCHWLT